MAADEPTTEAEALALWCARLPGLREQARATGVGERLDRDAARVREGGSAQRAVRKWLQDGEPEATRTWSGRDLLGMVGFPGAARTPTVGAGRYACPLDRCARTCGRDAQGHVPVCHAFGTAMQPNA
ncbi:hypothetical protein ACFYWX_38255 [Streptomyces sp. NPDC002888]|uniref:hypothetical protein n=1 Tax=Streptomyces sp. NPDC002888 TaxID=3364668 RepID=UPI0036B30923